MKSPDTVGTIEASEARKLTARAEGAKRDAEIERMREEDHRLCERFTATVWPAIQAAIKQGSYIAWIDVPSLKTTVDPVSLVVEDLRKLGYRAEVTTKCFGKVLAVDWS